MTGALKISSGRNRPDLAPVYRLFEQLTDSTVQVDRIYHWDVEGRVVDERADPQADILLTNSQPSRFSRNLLQSKRFGTPQGGQDGS